jgi:hypothetical protein
MNTTQNTQNITAHLPADLAAGIAKFDADVTAGVIRYDDPQSILATSYAGEAESDKSLAAHVIAHTLPV